MAIVLSLCGLVMFLNQAGVAIGAAVGGGSALPSTAIAVISLIVGLGSLAFFGWSSRRSFSPLIRLGWLRDPMVLLHLIAYMILPIVGIGFGYVITNLAQLSLGTNAFVAGALVLPGALIGAFFAPVGGMLYDRCGAFRPILGAFCAAICGPVLLLAFSMHLTPAMLAGFYFIFGLGYSLGLSNIMTNALNHINPVFMPDGNAVFNTGLQFGGVFHDSRSGPGRSRQGGERRFPPCHGRRRRVDLRHDDRHRRHRHLLLDRGVPYRFEASITCHGKRL